MSTDRVTPLPSALPDSGCHAPSIQLFLQPDGAVRACCRQLTALGWIGQDRLPDIWASARRSELVDRLARRDFSGGCENCEAEILVEGEEHSYPRFFDRRAAHLSEGPSAAEWPRWIDFNLSNACNLQCVHCSGDLSSAIRAHRDRRPPLRSPYDEQFFDDLTAFVPHLDGALFAGGEPFLASENYRVWDMVARLRPELRCMVTTNATQWNPRVQSVLEGLHMSVIVSIDAIDPVTFAAIRVGASLPVVLENLERYRRVVEHNGATLTVNHCLMPANVDRFEDLLRWAERSGLRVEVSVVREPAFASISRLPAAELRSVSDALERRRERVAADLELNRQVWLAELDRIRSWAGHVERSTAVSLDRTVMGFRCRGSGPNDARSAEDELRQLSADGSVVVLEVGEDDVITAVSASASALLGDSPVDLIGRHFASVDDVSERRFGPRRRYEVLSSGTDRVDALVQFGVTTLRLAMVAVRDRDGTARSGRVVIAVVPSAESA